MRLRQFFKTLSARIKRVGLQDCRIAAQALRSSLIVVTRNIVDLTAAGVWLRGLEPNLGSREMSTMNNLEKLLRSDAFAQRVNRRAFLHQSAYGLGGLALGQLLGTGEAWAAPPSGSGLGRGAILKPQFPVRAKRIIHLCMAGGPSHLETLDNKPKLRELHGQPFPDSLTKGQQLAQLQGAKLIARGPSTQFKKWGQSGQEISELFPHIGGIADEIAIIRSMVTEQINHDPAQAFMNSGSILKGRPSMGSWLLYGLGAETDNLPGFVVLVSQGRGGAQPVSARQWASGFLPGKFQGVQFQTRGDAVHYVGSPEGVLPEYATVGCRRGGTLKRDACVRAS